MTSLEQYILELREDAERYRLRASSASSEMIRLHYETMATRIDIIAGRLESSVLENIIGDTDAI